MNIGSANDTSQAGLGSGTAAGAAGAFGNEASMTAAGFGMPPFAPPPYGFPYPPYAPYPAYAAPPWMCAMPPPAGVAPPAAVAAGPAPDPAAPAAGMAQLMQDLANGNGNALSGLTQLLNLDDKEFWKGALVGAAAVLLLTNEGVQRALFRGAVKSRDAVQGGVRKVKERTGGARRARNRPARSAQKTED